MRKKPNDPCGSSYYRRRFGKKSKNGKKTPKYKTTANKSMKRETKEEKMNVNTSNLIQTKKRKFVIPEKN